MKDTFEDAFAETKPEEKEPEVVETETKSDKRWWIGKTCSFCNETNNLSIFGNGLARCPKHLK